MYVHWNPSLLSTVYSTVGRLFGIFYVKVGMLTKHENYVNGPPENFPHRLSIINGPNDIEI